MPDYMILYCLNKGLCGWSERVGLVSDDKRITSCPECGSIALIYDKDQTQYIENPDDENTISLIIKKGLLKVATASKSEEK